MAEKLRSAEPDTTQQDTTKSEVDKKRISLSATAPSLEKVVETIISNKKENGIESSILESRANTMMTYLNAQIALALSQSKRKDMLEFYKQNIIVNEDGHHPKSDIQFSGLKKIGGGEYSAILESATVIGSDERYVHFTVTDGNTLTITAFYKK